MLNKCRYSSEIAAVALNNESDYQANVGY